MLRRRNLVALVLAGLMSLGTLGVAFAQDSSSYVPDLPSTDTQTAPTGVWVFVPVAGDAN